MCTTSHFPRETFAHTGLLLFGHTWPAEMAGALNVNLEHITQWRTGELQIPEETWKKLREIAQKRKMEVNRAINKLKGE